MPAAFSATYSGGDGTEADPYLIANPTDLLTLSNPANSADWSAYFLMTNNINMTGIATFTPIAPDTDPDTVGFQGTSFTGVFDGGGFAIQNLTITLPTQSYIGIFGCISGASSLIKNLGVQNISMEGTSDVSGLAGLNEGTIIECYTTGAVSGNSSVGGLIGENSGSVTNCFSNATVTGNTIVGGLVGKNNMNAAIISCYTAGAVSGTNNLGGLGGHNLGQIIACYASTLVTGDGPTMNGLVGNEDYEDYVWSSVKLSFWDMELSGLTGSCGGKGLTSAQMRTRSIFQNAGWGAYGWVMDNGQLPRLEMEGTSAPQIPPPETIPLSGNGTEGDPYLVGTPEEFGLLSWHASILDKHIRLTADLQCEGITLYPIGDLSPFEGVFDGMGHALENVIINQPNSDIIGLFSFLEPDARISNLAINNGVINGRNIVGGLAGVLLDTSFSENGAIVDGCSFNGRVTGSIGVGGLIGGCLVGTVSESFATGRVTGTSNYVGGLIGGYVEITVVDCHAITSVIGYDSVGGLIGGYATSLPSTPSPDWVSVTDCYATGNVSGHDNIGGLIGKCGFVTSCFATGNVMGNNNIGGLIGKSGSAANCYATGNVSGSNAIGGLLGQGTNSTNCYAVGTVSGDTNLGGLVGSGGTVTASFWDKDLGGPNNGYGTGLTTAQMKQRTSFESAGWSFAESPPGWAIFEDHSYPFFRTLPMPIDSISTLQLLSTVSSGSYILTRDLDARETADWTSKSTQPGFLPIGTASQPFNGTLEGAGHRILGLHIYRPTLDNVGLFGYIGASGVVRGIGLEAADITGGNQTGGLAGINLGTVEQCYVQGGVTGANDVGGLLGQNGGTVRESYAAATLSGASTGGLIGADASGSVSASFWDTLISGTTFSGGGTGLSTEVMHQFATFAVAGWDISNTWIITEGFSYPFFRSSLILRVVKEPSRLINADTLDIEIETYVPNLFVTIGGGAYPAYRNFSAVGQGSITVPLKQEAINELTISTISEKGVERVISQYDVYESVQFPSTPMAITALTLQPASANLAPGATQQFTCVATFADNSTGDVTPVASWNIAGGSITTVGLYTGTGNILALLNTEQGWLYSNIATVSPAKGVPMPKAESGQVGGIVLSHYTGLGLLEARVTAYNLLNPTVQAQHSVYDAFGNYAFFMNEGKYHFEGSCAGHRSELALGGQLLEESVRVNPGPPEQWTEPYYSGQVKANRPLSYDFSLRPNDAQAPWVVFIEPVADTTVNTEHIVVTAIDTDKYSELGVAKYTHNTVDYDIPDKISSTGFYRDTWALKLGINVLHLYTVDTESNASEKTIQITYDPAYNTPGGDNDGDGMPNQWETDHGLNPTSAEGVNGATGDLDNDTMTNLEEYRRGTLPNSPNSDSDTLTDDFEVRLGTNPLEPDTDGDGVNDDIEWQLGSDPLHDDRIKVSIVNLKDGMSVRGDAVTILAETLPGDNPALVASVSIEVNGPGTGGAWRVVGTPASAPFTATWNTTNFTAGTYLIHAVASSMMGHIDSEPQYIVVTVSPTAPYFERIHSGQHRLTAPVPLVSQTVLALREGARFAKITIPTGALAADDTLTAFFPDPSSFTPSFPSLQQDARLYLDLTLVSHTGNFLNGKYATIEMNYPDGDLDDHLDDSGLRVPFLSMCYLPAPASAFVPLVSSTLNRLPHCLVGETTHFSTFGIIEEQPAPPLNLLTTSLPQGTTGTPYAITLDADGGSEPYTWSVTSGTLPVGLGIVGNTLTGTPTAAGSFPITLQVADAQSTPYTASRSFTLEIFAADQPTVTLSLHPGQASITNTLSAWWDITFSEPVSGFDTSGVTLTGTASPGAVYEVAGSGASYTLEVKTLTRDGTLHPTVPSEKAAGIATSAPNRASANEQEIWVDRTKPKVQITSVYSGLQQYGTSGSIILKTLPILFTLTFDESVTGLTTSDITFTGLTPQPDFHVYGTAKNYTILITSAAADSILTPTLIADAALDAASNGMADTAYTGREVHYVPETRATVTINQRSTQADPTKSFPIYYDIIFSAPVTDFTEDDLVYIGTAPDPDYDLDVVDATAYTLTVNSSTGDGRFAFHIPEDVTAEGNAASTSTDNMVTYDATPPAIALGAPSSSKTCQGPVSFTLTYTGASAITLVPTDVILNGAPTATVSVTGTGSQARVVILSGISGAGPLGISLKQGTAIDAAGNLAPAAGPSATTGVDPRATVTLNQRSTQADPAKAFPVYYDIVFNTPVTGFDTSDVVYAGTASNPQYAVSGSGTAYTLTVNNASTDGRLAFYIPEDVTIEGNAASTSTDNVVTYDATPPAITIGAPSPSKTRQGPISFSITYTGASAITLAPADVLLNGAPTANVSVTGTGNKTRVVTLSGLTGMGALGISLKPGTAVDAAGNLALAAGPSATADVDPRLTVTINQSPGQRDPNNRLPLYFTIEFNDEVTGFDASDITFISSSQKSLVAPFSRRETNSFPSEKPFLPTGSATGLDYEITGSGASYTLKITTAATPGTIMPAIPANACQGVWGGINVASTSTDNSIYYDPALALALFTAEPTEGHTPMTVQFTDQSILGILPIEAWDWNFGDGATSIEQNPRHTYENMGDYTVSLTVTTPAGSTTWTLEDYIHVQIAMPLTRLAGLFVLVLLLAFIPLRRKPNPN